MRLPWRKRDSEPVFDPDAGEIPEHLEIHPPSEWTGKVWLTVAGSVFGFFVIVVGAGVIEHSARKSAPSYQAFVTGDRVRCETSVVPTASSEPGAREVSLTEGECTPDRLATDGQSVLDADGHARQQFVRTVYLLDLAHFHDRVSGFTSTVSVDPACYRRHSGGFFMPFRAESCNARAASR